MANNKNIPTAHKILSSLLKIERKQSIKGDAKQIANVIGKSERCVSAYIRGEVRDLNTASVILKELRKLISNREYEASQLAA